MTNGYLYRRGESLVVRSGAGHELVVLLRARKQEMARMVNVLHARRDKRQLTPPSHEGSDTLRGTPSVAR